MARRLQAPRAEAGAGQDGVERLFVTLGVAVSSVVSVASAIERPSSTLACDPLAGRETADASPFALLLGVQNLADLKSAPSDRGPRAVSPAPDAEAAQPCPADDAAAQAAASEMESQAAADFVGVQADIDALQTCLVCVPPEGENAREATSHRSPGLKPLDVSTADEVAATTEAAAIALGLAAASTEKFGGNTGHLEHDARAMNPGQLPHPALADRASAARSAGQVLLSGMSIGSTLAMSGSTSEEKVSNSVANQTEAAAQLSKEGAMPLAEGPAKAPTIYVPDSAGPEIPTSSTPNHTETVASNAVILAATRNAASSPPGNGTGAGARLFPAPPSTPEAILASVPSSDGPMASLSVTQISVASSSASSPHHRQSASLSEPPNSTPVTTGATRPNSPPKVGASPAPANSPTPVPAIGADAPATSFDTNAVANSGANGEGRQHFALSPEPQHRPAPESRPSLPGHLIVAPATLEAPADAAATAPAPQIASSHGTPAAVPAYNVSSGPITLTDLPLAIALQTKAGKSRFAIRLDPPELGRIDVRLDIDTRNNVMVRLVAERPETLELLRRDAGHIERALQDAGLKTGDQALQFSLQNHFDHGEGAAPESEHFLLVQDEAPAPTLPPIYAPSPGLGTGLDIRV